MTGDAESVVSLSLYFYMAPRAPRNLANISNDQIHSRFITITTCYTRFIPTRLNRYNFGAPLFSVIFLTAASPLAPPT